MTGDVTHDDILGMADDQFGDMDTAFLDAPVIAEEADGDVESQSAPEGESPVDEGGFFGDALDAADDAPEQETAQQDDGAEDDDDGEDDSDADDATDGDADAGDESDNSDDVDGDGDSDSAGDSDDADQDDKDKDADDDQPDAELKSFVDKIKAPFKANGKTMQVDNADDAIRLMQMGANYNRKMAGMKPHLKVLKTLEKYKIDESKLSYLIDLEQKNPEAIAKLLEDSNIDPVDFEAKGKDYKATDHTVSDKEVAMDEVLDEIKDTDTFKQTIDVVGGQWDKASKAAVQDQPELIRVINDHMATGVYDVINTQIEKDRMLGRLSGLSDIEAYQKVGDALAAQGGFDHLFKQEEGQRTTPVTENRSPEPEAKANKRREKRKAASPTKAKPGTPKPKDFNPLGLSDDEFLKQIDDRFI